MENLGPFEVLKDTMFITIWVVDSETSGPWPVPGHTHLLQVI